MQRRHYLACCGAALSAGCSGFFDTSGRESFDAPTRDPETEDEHPVTVEDRQEDDDRNLIAEGPTVSQFAVGNRTVALVPGAIELEDGVTASFAFTAPATAEHPARVAATIENRNGWDETVDTESIPLFGASTAYPTAEFQAEEPTVVVAAPTPAHPLAEEPAEWAQGQSVHWRLAGSTEDFSLPPELELGPREEVTGEYALVTAGASGFPTGRYSFGADLSVVAWERDAPGPAQLSMFEDPSIPALGDGPGTTSWFHEATHETPVFLRPSQESVSLPASLGFEFVNHSTQQVTGNPDNWQLFKRTDDGWKAIRFGLVGPTARRLLPGEKNSWSLLATHGDPLDVPDTLGMGHLGGGTYAFGVSYRLEDRFDYMAALVTVDAPAVSVEADANLTVEQDGDTVVVTSPAVETAREPATMVLEPASSADRTLVPEQVMQVDPLRNTVPFVTRPDVARARYRGPEVEWLAGDDQPFRFGFDGQSFVLRQVRDEQT
ncbi:hypothetical protein [Haloarchaeobius amylolyticus]|uniref:hypothetical protein n=1 Tax=Haloarchaeobius amylolyticus TaxID=1198296 RepID=UPI00226EA87D|nr:hypothetical protein [Haloarchaeobius amylolyticus]